MLSSRVEKTNSCLLSRVGARVLTAAAGGAVGWWLGQRMGHPTMLALLCAAAAVLALSVLDTLKGYQILDWLRTPEANAPEMPGLWGEVAHRFQRVIRQRDQLLAEEQRRLDPFLS